MKIEELGLSVRAENALNGPDIKYVGDLIQISETDLLRIRNLGIKSLKEIKSRLAVLDFELGSQTLNWNHGLANQWRDELEVEVAKQVQFETNEQMVAITGNQASFLEEELHAITTLLTKPANIQIILSRWGWSGHQQRTLEDVARDLNVTGRNEPLTRERVRQIDAKALRKLKLIHPPAPILTKAVEFIMTQCPASERDIVDSLIIAGITRQEFELSGISLAAWFLGIEWPIERRHVDNVSFWFPVNHMTQPVIFVSEARRLTSRHGCVNFEDLAERTGFQGSALLRFAEYLVEHHPKLVSLSGAREWLIHTDAARNRLENMIRKVFSAVGRVHISELRIAIGRHRRIEVVPPRRVLKAFCERLVFLEVEGDFIQTKNQEPIEPELGEMEAIIVRAFQEHGKVLSRPVLEEACVALGMNRNSFYVMLSYSPIICQLARGVYALVGAEVPPGLIEDLRPDYKKQRRLIDDGWTTDGKPWFAVELSESMVLNGVIGIPGGMKTNLQGDWVLFDPSSQNIRTLRIKETSLWRVGPPLRRVGAEPGDVVAFVFDLLNNSVRLHIGGHEIVERLRDTIGVDQLIFDGDEFDDDDVETE